MKNIFNFAMLDFRIMRPYYKSVLIGVGLGLLFSIFTESGDMMLTMGAVMTMLVGSYPFMIAEKNQLDTLYGTLTVDRKSVVFGRYLFTVVFGLCNALLSFGGYIILQSVFGQDIGLSVSMLMLCVIISVYLILISVQYPTYFKFGPTKGKLVGYIPLIILFGLVTALPLIAESFKIDISISDIFQNMVKYSAVTCAALLLAGAAAVCISCVISKRIYEKRDI